MGIYLCNLFIDKHLLMLNLFYSVFQIYTEGYKLHKRLIIKEIVKLLGVKNG